MQLISLLAIPNQSFVTTQDNDRYQIRIFECNGIMATDIIKNRTSILSGNRICLGNPLIPFPYLENTGGNFIFVSQTEDEVYYNLFGVTQQLFYLGYAEMIALLA